MQKSNVSSYINKKSIGLTVILVLIVGMALGLTDLIGDNGADKLVHEFGDLEGVDAEILSISDDTEPAIHTTNTMQTEKILSLITCLEAFDEVIQRQIL